MAATGRILLDVTDLVSLLSHRDHPTGIPRVVYSCLFEFHRSAREVVPVLFSRTSRSYCAIDAGRLLDRDRAYLEKVEPPRKDYWARLVALMGPLRAGFVRPSARDTILILGVGWDLPKRHDFLFGPRMKGRRVVWFCHDLIPLLHPGALVAPEGAATAFGQWIDAALGSRHEFICASNAVVGDLRGYAARKGHDVDISTVALAHEFVPVRGEVSDRVAQLLRQPFVLCAGSISKRKNQSAMARVWHRLHSELGDRLPILVLVGDLIDSEELELFLRKTGNVGGKAVLLGPVSEAELSRLYEACEFTVFPSLNEGWGLPVGESLWMGKPCVCSNATSLPEVGGDFAVYFDPRDEQEMGAVLHRAVLGEFSSLPPPRSLLRTWRQVSADLLAAL